MRAFAVVNPAAGGGRARRLWPGVKDRLCRLGVELEFAETTGPGAGSKLARSAVDSGWPFVIAVGGDGTVNEVVNGITDAAAQPLATLGVIAAGRGRDVCRNFGVATNADAAADRLVDGEDVVADLGVAQWNEARRRYFVNSAGVGFDAAVAERTQSGRLTGTIPYVLGIVNILRTYRRCPTSIVLDDHIVFDGPAMAAVVANGPHYGGGMKIAPAADPADGSLDLVVVGDLGGLELLRWLPTVYRGKHLGNPKITVGRGRIFRITAGAPLPVHLDGESVEVSPVQMKVCPRALRLRR
jgi:YegS/Rv2252/BmrU family lipid kinase